MKIIQCVLVLTVAATALPVAANTVDVNNDYGCDRSQNVLKRERLIEDQLSPIPETMKRRPQIRQELVELTQASCKPLSGTFKVIETREGMTRIETKSGRFWVLAA